MQHSWSHPETHGQICFFSSTFALRNTPRSVSPRVDTSEGDRIRAKSVNFVVEVVRFHFSQQNKPSNKANRTIGKIRVRHLKHNLKERINNTVFSTATLRIRNRFVLCTVARVSGSSELQFSSFPPMGKHGNAAQLKLDRQLHVLSVAASSVSLHASFFDHLLIFHLFSFRFFFFSFPHGGVLTRISRDILSRSWSESRSALRQFCSFSPFCNFSSRFRTRISSIVYPFRRRKRFCFRVQEFVTAFSSKYLKLKI